jgi:hypothetical protein
LSTSRNVRRLEEQVLVRVARPELGRVDVAQDGADDHAERCTRA